MDVAGARITFTGDRVFESKFATPQDVVDWWATLPDTGILIILVFLRPTKAELDAGLATPGTLYRSIHHGSDFYYVTPDGRFGHPQIQNDTRGWINKTFPGAVIKAGEEIDGTAFETLRLTAMGDKVEPV